MSSENSLQKAAMRAGDFHLRSDRRQMFGNYVELSPIGGQGGVLSKARRSAMLVATPVYDEPKIWEIEILFSAPRGTILGVSDPLPPTPWIANGFNFTAVVTILSAIDRDKQTQTERFLVVPIGNGAQNTFPIRFRHAHQLSVSVELIGTTSQLMGVQASVAAVDVGDRDAFGSAAINALGTPAATPFPQSIVTQLFLPTNALRRQFFVQNWGTAPLFVQFGASASSPSGGPPSWTFALPSRGDVYESPRDCWQGEVSGVWSTASAAITDFAMVTEGT